MTEAGGAHRAPLPIVRGRDRHDAVLQYETGDCGLRAAGPRQISPRGSFRKLGLARPLPEELGQIKAPRPRLNCEDISQSSAATRAACRAAALQRLIQDAGATSEATRAFGALGRWGTMLRSRLERCEAIPQPAGWRDNGGLNRSALPVSKGFRTNASRKLNRRRARRDPPHLSIAASQATRASQSGAAAHAFQHAGAIEVRLARHSQSAQMLEPKI